MSPDLSNASQLGEKVELTSEKKQYVINKDSVIKVMEHVANWQIANHGQSNIHDLKWNNTVFYIGLMELSKISKDSCYRKWLLKMGWKYNWQPFSRMYMADDIAVSQMYLDIYRIEGDERMLNSTYARTEWVINHPSVSDFLYDAENYIHKERWSWCDALFMALPVYAQMYNITHDVKFLEFMDKEYHFVEMCERICTLQNENGYWHSSLPDRQSYPDPETSASSLYVYAFAYGVGAFLLAGSEIYRLSLN
jgi:rhamnogalacturonyl hydrolase YesR